MPSALSWLVLSLASALAACSFTAIKRVPGNYKSGTYQSDTVLACSDGLTHPLIDMAGTVLAGVVAVSLISANDSGDLKVASYSSAAVGLGFAASALYGILHVNRCRNTLASEGVVSPSTRAPIEDREPAGTHGGVCNEDGSCDGDLICDQPMQVCVPLNPDKRPDEDSP